MSFPYQVIFCFKDVDDVIDLFTQECGLQTLSTMIIENDDCQVKKVIAKCFLVIAKRRPDHKYQILLSAFLPSIHQLVRLTSTSVKNILNGSKIPARELAIRNFYAESAKKYFFDSGSKTCDPDIYSYLNVVSVFLDSPVFDNVGLTESRISLDKVLGGTIQELSTYLLDLMALPLIQKINMPKNLENIDKTPDFNLIPNYCLGMIPFFCKYGLFYFKY